MQYKNIQHLEADGIVEVVLNRPDVRNAFHPEMIAELTKEFRQLSKRKDLRAVVLRGEGKVFCAGADLAWMKEMVKYSLPKNKKDSEKLFEMFQAIAECSHPVIGMLHGAAFGGAIGIAACCDIVISEENTQYCFSEVKLGLAPAVISHFVLKKVPVGLAAPWMLVGRVFNAREAQVMGLCHILVAQDQMNNMKNTLLNQLGEAGPEAVRATKALIAKVPGLKTVSAKAETTKVIAQRRVSSEGQEGLKAFLEKRTPEWKTQWKVRS